MSTVEMILAGMQLFISAATIITLLYTLRKFLKKPQETLEKRVSDLEIAV